MTNKNRIKLARLRLLGKMLWLYAIGFLAIGLTVAVLTIVFGNISSLVLGCMFVVAIALIIGLIVASIKLDQLTNKQGDITQYSVEKDG